MRSNKVFWLIQRWVGTNLPKDHIFVARDKRPGSTVKLFILYFKKWLTHPIKRRLARYYVAFLKRFFGLEVVAITGSAGKTSTKDMISSVLSQKGKTVKSFKNIDPVYNIPSTILKCSPRTKYLVLEMGVEFRGEMDFYLWLVKPSIAVITNIYPVHTQFFGDVEGVFEEKTKLARSLGEKGVAILYNEDERLKRVSKQIKARVIFYGRKGDVRATNIKTKGFKTSYTLNLGGKKEDIRLPLVGEHFVFNSLAVAAVGDLCGVSLRDIKKELEKPNLPSHRMEILKFDGNLVVFDDSYNSNPVALKGAVDSFANAAGGKGKIAILGDMLELGEKQKEYHKEAGKLISSSGIDVLIGVGPHSKTMVEEARKNMQKGNCHWVGESREVFGILAPFLKNDTSVLIKGSRSIGLEAVVEDIRQRYNRK